MTFAISRAEIAQRLFYLYYRQAISPTWLSRPVKSVIMPRQADQTPGEQATEQFQGAAS
jgi:hypothetical protein